MGVMIRGRVGGDGAKRRRSQLVILEFERMKALGKVVCLPVNIKGPLEFKSVKVEALPIKCHEERKGQEE